MSNFDVRDEAACMAAMQKLKDVPPAHLVLDAATAWTLLAALQLAYRHPAMPVGIRKIVRHVAGAIAAAICVTPELVAMAESGWNPAYDYVQKKETLQ